MKTIRRFWFATILLSLLPWSTAALTVVLDDNYPPYSFRGSSGQFQGVLFDQWALWSVKTGEPVRLLAQPWSQALETMASGQADVLDTVFLTPDRAQVYEFTAPYAAIDTAVFVQAGLVEIHDLGTLEGFEVGIKKGDAAAEPLRQIRRLWLKEYPSYEALIEAAGRGEVQVFCMDSPPARHLLSTKGLRGQFRQAFVLAQDGFRRAVHKGRPEVLSLVNQGFDLITDQERQAIQTRWEGEHLVAPLDIRTLAVVVVGGLAVILLLVVVVFVLRHQIRRRAGQLAGTERRLKLSEEWSRAVVEALPDLLYILDNQGLVLTCRAPTDSSLYEDPERFVGQNVIQILPAPLAAQVLERLQALRTSNRVPLFEGTFEVRERMRTFEARFSRIAEGRVLAIVRDVSADRRAQEADLHRNKLESLGVLAGGLAHDFNNSLAVIQGFVSLARVQLTTPDRALASLDKAVQATRRAAGLTGQLRVLAHGNEVHRTLVSIKEIAEEAASFALVGTPCVLAVETAEGPWTVEADPDQLSQVFHNLILNAVQAMPHGGTITLVFRSVDHERLAVSVVDQGQGIPAHQLSRVFDPYFSTKPKGTGLGLSVVHAVVDRHGGTISIDSREGRGTVITVEFPRARGAVVLPTIEPVQGAEEMKGHRVLIMEDEEDLRDLMVHVVGSLGMVPQACRNGREAVTAFDAAAEEGTPFILVISDLLVPGDMGGREMVSILRDRPGQFKALAVTGFSTERSEEDFHNHGFDVIMGKPFTIDELRARVVELMKTPWKTASNT